MGLQELGMQVAGTAIDTGMGLLLEKHNDRRQIRQQQKLQDMQMKGNKEMQDYANKKQLEMWNATNYAAQLEQMKKAGLSPGLIYGSSGGGGTTIGQGGMGVTGGQAPGGGGEVLAMRQLGLQMKMQEAQIENVKADTRQKQVNTGIQEQTGLKQALADIDNTISSTGNNKAQMAWTNVKTDIEKITQGFTKDTLQAQLDLLEHNTDIAYETLKQNRVQTYLDQATRDKAQEAIELGIVEQITRIALGNSNIKVNEKSIEQMTQNITNSIRSLDQTDTKLAIEKFKAEITANYPGTGAVIGRALDGAVETVDKLMKGKRQKTHEIK